MSLSSGQQTLTDYQTTTSDPELDTDTEEDGDGEDQGLSVPEWATNINADTNHQCECGHPVSGRYHQFHRDEDGVLRRCQHCRTQTDMMNGAGAVDDYERRGTGDDEEEGDDNPEDSLFGETDTSHLPSYMQAGGD